MPPIKTAPSNELLVLGAGEIWFDPFDANGDPTGFFHFGNSDRFALNITTEKLTVKDYMHATRGTYKEITREIAVGIAATTMEVSVLNAAVGLLGATGKTAQASTSVTDEGLTPAAGLVLGRTYKTALRGISAVAVSKGATALVAVNPVTGVGDYEIVDAAAGLIRVVDAPTTSGLVAGDDLTVDYTAAALTGATALDIIDIGAKPQWNGRLFFKSDNVFGPNYDYELWNVALRPDGAVSLIGDEIMKLGFAGSTQSDAVGRYGGSAASPFGRKVFRAAA